MVDFGPGVMDWERRTIEWILLQRCKLGDEGYTSQEVVRMIMTVKMMVWYMIKMKVDVQREDDR